MHHPGNLSWQCTSLKQQAHLLCGNGLPQAEHLHRKGGRSACREKLAEQQQRVEPPALQAATGTLRPLCSSVNSPPSSAAMAL